jgi:methionyl-tRNA formyltransferase
VRLIFAGTPAHALPSLEALLASPRHTVAAVLTRPDAPAGRGRAVHRSPVRERAEAAGVPVLAPARLAEPGVVAELAAVAADCCAVVAFGALVPPAALALPPRGWVNLHFSLLPAWRGAAPVQHALLAGDEVTGATTFLLEEGLDTGPVLGRLTTAIGPRDTAGELLDRLSRDGAGLLVATVDGLADGTLVPRPQPADGVSLAPKLAPADARVDWAAPALAVDRRVRACTPAPGAWTTFRDRRLKLGPVRPTGAGGLPPGRLAVAGHGILVGTGGGGDVALGDVQPAGRGQMPAAAWARGVRLAPEDRFA